MSERHEFRTEARQLLDLMIHSVYSNKDIFLRELISNSSDALDKRRFEAVRQPELLPEGTELAIRIDTDPAARTLSVSDNGIGMTRDEVRDLIGTIAKSGTQEFLKALREAKDAAASTALIGQFGVGFYSTFMAADRVVMVTRRAGEETATRWESAGDGWYTLEDAERDAPGTTVTLHLKPADEEDGLKDFTKEWEIRQLVRQYSDFVAYPVRMEVERTERDGEGEGAERTVRTLETLNSMKAIWLRGREEVPEEEYHEFYRHISHDWNDPLLRIQAKIEGTLEYRLLLYIPSKAPWDLAYRHMDKARGVHLYVKRVFIMDDCSDLLPEYLRFVRGVVDSEDLPLNISREILQQNRQIQRMNRGVTAKVLGALKDLAEKDPEKYAAFWAEFGRVLKEGLFQDAENRGALLDLARLRSTAGDAETSLADYVSRMQPGQTEIYYLTGDNLETLRRSPHLEGFAAKGWEVLLLSDPVDEVWTGAVEKYGDFAFVSAARGTAAAGTEEERKQEEEARSEREKEDAPLLARMKEALGDRVKDVRLSSRLTESAACLVSDEGDLSPQLERILKAMGQEAPAVKRILELNPDHPVMVALRRRHAEDPDAPVVAEYAELLHGQAVLAEGGQLPDPAAFARRVADLMARAAD
ncbi:MAG: molecular chaperone HtpG [Candidatus Hydrogenedentes bacterium]|nr:molecular chaperone HtpG [Candidatus Hydrogenedentota bacterium]